MEQSKIEPILYEKLKIVEKKFSFLKQYYSNEIEIFIDEWEFYKENVEYSIWLSDSDFISILVKNEKVEIVFEKKIV